MENKGGQYLLPGETEKSAERKWHLSWVLVETSKGSEKVEGAYRVKTMGPGTKFGKVYESEKSGQVSFKQP